MAYLSKEETKIIREKIKNQFGKDFKFSITNSHFTSINVNLMSSPIDFPKENIQINHYRIEESLKETPNMAEVFKKIFEIITSTKDYYDRNAGDPFADYGDQTFFINLSIGKWDKPYICTKK